MKKFQKKYILYLIFALSINIYNIYGQTSNEIVIYNWFDKNIGIESLDLKNGSAHLNFDKTINNQNRYYISDNFKIGSINYNNQNYFNLYLKYDIYADELVLRPYDGANSTKINIIKENVSFFKIGNEKFVNLKEINSIIFRGGYYEEVLVGNSTILYVKYYKEKKKIIKEELSLIEYLPKYEFILIKENNFFLIKDKKEIVKLYPNDKKKINDFYFMNRNLRKDDPSLFMKNLMKYLNNSNF